MKLRDIWDQLGQPPQFEVHDLQNANKVFFVVPRDPLGAYFLKYADVQSPDFDLCMGIEPGYAPFGSIALEDEEASPFIKEEEPPLNQHSFTDLWQGEPVDVFVIHGTGTFKPYHGILRGLALNNPGYCTVETKVHGQTVMSNLHIDNTKFMLADGMCRECICELRTEVLFTSATTYCPNCRKAS